MIKKTVIVVVLAMAVGGFYWYEFVSLKESPMPQSEILDAYRYSPNDTPEMTITETDTTSYEFTFRSFDGAEVFGKIAYPVGGSGSYPVLIGVSAMGRSYVRWWVESFNNNPTVTQVNKIAALAISNGHAVVSIDARYHGKRKDPDRTLNSIMNDLHLFGDKTDYEAMIRDTVLDHRVLIDWIEQQDDLDSSRITVVGYSMGGQIGLLLGSLESRVSKVISIVPPFIDDKIALVAPKNLVSLLGDRPVLLITATDDENASSMENDYLFDLLPGANKERIEFEGGHILPDDYVESLRNHFQ